MRRFIGEAVEVGFAEGSPYPAWIEWRGQRLTVSEVLSDSREVDFHSRWWQRRHRRRLVIRVEDGRVMEIHGRRPGSWTLYQELDDPLA